MLRYMSNKLQVGLDETDDLFFVNITTGGYGVRFSYEQHDDKYWLGLFNSKLLDWCVKPMTNRFRGGYFAMNKQAVERLPIRAIDFGNTKDVARHDKMVALVETMLDLHKQLPGLAGIRREVVAQQIEVTDRAIDALVYALYGLNDDEIAIVEGRG